ncbi:hypothetical protein Tcan_02618 [Toxocara canis]|uniref:G-protein coupled receptors family 1 profile domain-containing protein n=1 Tax=Toxocara canis TaxID=6265 RepID=A0A0B2W5E5_TOXCA|nr:hypothetical protein Tcan_02618 [Toxocara canis]
MSCYCDLDDEWLPPFDDVANVAALCIKQNRDIVMLRRGVPMMYSLFRHDVLCWLDIQRYVPPRYSQLVWFLQSLGYCDVNRAINWRRRGVEYKRDFQLMITRAAFSLICRQTEDIGRYHLNGYAAVFRIMFEKVNEDREHICEAVESLYKNLYRRCHVGEPAGRIRLLGKICSGRSTVRLLKMRAFFLRFSQSCYTFDDFYNNDPRTSVSLGYALSNDTVFMNLLSTNLIGAISSDSQLPQIVLKTRLLLQHFSLAAVKIRRTIDNAIRCSTNADSTQLLLYASENDDNMTNVTDLNYETEEFNDECNTTNEAYANVPNIQKFREIARFAEIGFTVEASLLAIVVLNTIMLSTFLLQTKDHLSTATILFIFNILFSNVLFIASFICLFIDFFDEKPYGQLSEESFDGSIGPSLAIAESLNTHLFAANDFNRHIIQETLYSLAQNGSLLGLTNLLVLVLVVIHRSMEGKAIHLSKTCVVVVFSLVWLLLFVSHFIFSALQFTAIHSVDEMFMRLASSRQSLDCKSKPISEYAEIGERCDSVAPFHNFGVYLLRGHTFFTITFLAMSLLIFMTTMICHWKVRKQHHLLGNGVREHAPQRRRETLFNTLVLSIGAYFVSIAGQTFIEIYVFCVRDREDVARIAQWFQLARIAAFVDPVFNPLLVSIRTPALRRKEWPKRTLHRKNDSSIKHSTVLVSSRITSSHFATLIKPISEYAEIGERCDSVAPFHNFGVYLLRGHTFFTITFLAMSLLIFMTTMICHWKVRKQHHLLGNGVREHAPQRRRETLFNTLVLSIGAYFVSIAGQTFIEIYVFCVRDREDVARIAQWFQLARIAAFVDPVFNPLLVSIRTPALRRKIRCSLQYTSSLFAMICCPWRRHVRLKVKRPKRRTSSTTATADSSNSHRTIATHSDDLTLKFLCTQHVVMRSSSICNRSTTSQTPNSIV